MATSLHASNAMPSDWQMKPDMTLDAIRMGDRRSAVASVAWPTLHSWQVGDWRCSTHNFTSPNDARATPALIKTTITSVRCVGVSSPMRTDMPRTATEVKALSLSKAR